MNQSIHRVSPRKLICIPILFAEKGKKTYSVDYSSDLSEGGVLIQTENPLPVGTYVNLKFRLPNAIKLIEITGEVVWSHPYIPGQTDLNLIPGMGVKFLDISETAKIYIETFVMSEREKRAQLDDLLSEMNTGEEGR